MSYNYTDYLNYYNNNNILSDPNFEDNMICAVDVPHIFNGLDSLKFTKCKDFLKNNPSYQLTIVDDTTNSVDNKLYYFYAAMPKTYQSPNLLKHPDIFNIITISKTFDTLRDIEKNMTFEQRRDYERENNKKLWEKTSNIYCKYQSDYDSCMKTLMTPQRPTPIPDVVNFKSGINSTGNSDNNFGRIMFILFLILIFFLVIFLIYKNINKKNSKRKK